MFGSVYSEFPITSTKHMVVTSNDGVVNITLSVERSISVSFSLD